VRAGGGRPTRRVRAQPASGHAAPAARRVRGSSARQRRRPTAARIVGSRRRGDRVTTWPSAGSAIDRSARRRAGYGPGAATKRDGCRGAKQKRHSKALPRRHDESVSAWACRCQHWAPVVIVQASGPHRNRARTATWLHGSRDPLACARRRSWSRPTTSYPTTIVVGRCRTVVGHICPT
jgi:hypothetical protein